MSTTNIIVIIIIELISVFVIYSMGNNQLNEIIKA